MAKFWLHFQVITLTALLATSVAASDTYGLSLSCEGGEHSSEFKGSKPVQMGFLHRSLRTIHIKNRKVSDAECKIWTEDKIICSSGCLKSDEYCIPFAENGYFLKLDRITGEGKEKTWWTSQDGTRTSNEFFGSCRKIVGRKF